MYTRIEIDDLEVLRMFIDEWLECLEGLEKEILKLEIHSDDTELLNTIFRRVHSIKGGSSFAGVSDVTKVSHELEFTLDAIRKGKVTVSTELIDSLLLAVDFLNAYINQISNKVKENAFCEENGQTILGIECTQNEELVQEGLRIAREKCEAKKLEDSKAEAAAQETPGLDILQTEEFKQGLSAGMKEQFLFESTDHVEQIENHLLIQLDKNGDDKEAVHELFRAIHSIKGGAGLYLAALHPVSPGYAGLRKFSEVVHTFESLLALVRDKKCRLEKELIDLCYSVVDFIKSFLHSIVAEEPDQIPDNDILGRIEEYMSLIRAAPDAPDPGKAVIAPRETGKVEADKSKSSVGQSIRVNQEKLDKMMNMISELLIAKNSFLHISAKLNQEYDLPEMSKEVKQVGAYVNRISDELQNAIMSIRMIEVKNIFQKMPRVVRDIAQGSGKKMNLLMEGESTEIDKTIVEQISDPLVHLIRNAADHGIEGREERLRKGKPETGKIVLRAYNKNKYVYIEIEDDGKGIDAGKMKEKAVEKGFITSSDAEKMSQSQLVNLIFLPGFSTAQQVTEVSGRGVGMDIVKSNIAKINGNITIESQADRGTKMTIQLPLTLAVSRGLIVEAAGDSYIFPLEYIAQTVKVDQQSIHRYGGRCFIHLRGEVVGLAWLSAVFLTGDWDTGKEELTAVILSNGAEKYAIVVDKLKGEQEFVVKTLDGHLAAIPGISGSTLLGNGQVVLIVNPIDIIQLAQTGTANI